jgi:predicted phage terminase large subunit-like protein
MELLRRRRARSSLIAYANAIDVPGKPVSEDEDEWLFQPIETSLARHHIALLTMLQGLAEGTLIGPDGKSIKNAMVFMPPGSAKSTYGSVVFPTWVMGKFPRTRLILTSYASDIARKQGRRARQIVRSRKFSSIFGCEISTDTSAADEWSLTNESEFMAGGIQSGVTGNRAHGLIIDDPVSGREDADSEQIRKKTRNAYDDDLTTRLIPGAWTLMVTTRWHFDDLAGSILPENWKGESGDILCRDGQVWRVLCVPAIASKGDALGREPGELLWPEWFTSDHFKRYQANPRTWSALYQQIPAPDSGNYFHREWIRTSLIAPPRRILAVYGASDYAVTEDGGDYTVHGVVGVDPDGRIWLLDLWRSQSSSDVWVETFCDLVLKWKPIGWAEESGQIKASVGPFLRRRQLEREAYVAKEMFPTRGDKAIRAQSIRGRIAMTGLWVEMGAPFLTDLIPEMMSFPVGVHDDQVDMLGLIGQLLDKMSVGVDKKEQPKEEVPAGYLVLPPPPGQSSHRRKAI